MEPRIDEQTYEVGVCAEDGQSVVVFRGELDMAATDDLWDCMDHVRRSGAPLVVDLSDTTFMDSSGINLLMRAYKAQGQEVEGVTLRRPSEAVRMTLAMTGIDGVLRIDDRPPRRTQDA